MDLRDFGDLESAEVLEVDSLDVDTGKISDRLGGRGQPTVGRASLPPARPDGIIRTWDVTPDRAMERVAVLAFAFHAKRQILVSAGSDRTVRVSGEVESGR